MCGLNMSLLCHEKAERPYVQTDDLKRIINHNEKLTTPYAMRLSKLALGQERVSSELTRRWTKSIFEKSDVSNQ